MVNRFDLYDTSRIFALIITVLSGDTGQRVTKDRSDLLGKIILVVIVHFKVDVEIKTDIRCRVESDHVAARTADESELKSEIIPDFILNLIDDLNQFRLVGCGLFL